MTLYLPTTTLNASNILSSGSISPLSYYASRGFGIQSFEQIKETSAYKDVLLLLRSFPRYEIIGENASYPMVLEVDIDERRVKEAGIDGVYYCDSTIYLSPLNVRFHFITETAKQNAISRINQSDEAKFFALYKDRFVVNHANDNSLNLTELSLNGLSIEADSHEENPLADYTRDRLKGALIAYFIGCNGFGLLDNRFTTIDRLISELRGLFSRDGLQLLCDDTLKLRNKARQSYLKPVMPLSDLCHLSSDMQLSVKYKADNIVRVQFYEKIWNLVISESEVSQRELCERGGVLLASIYGQSWTDSRDRQYLTKLLNNVKNYDEFNIDLTDSPILKSFAAFVQRGCLGDWEKLQEYLDEKRLSIPDRRFIYGLYGGFTGFSTLSKTLTDTTGIPLGELVKLLCDVDDILNAKGNRTTVSESPFRGHPYDEFIPSRQVENEAQIDDVSSDTISSWLTSAPTFQELSSEARKYYIGQIKKLNIDIPRLRKEDLSKFKYYDKTKTKWGKVISELFSKKKVQASLFPSTAEEFISKCFNGLDNEITRRLVSNWEYVCKTEKDKDERIKFFINLCKKESRGDTKFKRSPLLNKFDLKTAEESTKKLTEMYSAFYD